MKDSARRWWAMAAISVSVLVVSLDLTVLSLALPTIAGTMHASTADLQWITDAYSLVIAALILPAGLLGDRYGRKKVLLAALVVFAASSVWCAYSASVGELIAARAALGIGAAAVFPMAISVIPVMFAEQERQKAISVMAGALFLSYPIGPIVGGFLLDHFWWGSVFLINVPVVAIALVAVTLLLPESRASKRPRLDFPGIVISSAGLTALTYGFIRAGQDGWTDTLALATIVAGLAILAGFVWWERFAARRSGSQPLVDLSLFGVASFRWGTILMTFVSFAMFGLFFTAPQYFQDVRGATPLGSGLRLLPLIGGMLVGMIAGSRLTEAVKLPDGTRGDPRVSAKLAVAAGFLVMAAGLVIGACTGLGSSAGYASAVDHDDRARPRARDAGRDERRGRAADGGAQRLGRRPDVRGPPGRRHHRRRGARHADQQRLHQPAAPGRTALGSRVGGPVERRRRRRGGAAARLARAARHGAVRVHPRHGHHALDLRRDRRHQRPAGARLPAAPLRPGAGRARGAWLTRPGRPRHN